MILDSLLAGTILFTSFAMRTPNIQPNPDDYEFSLGFSNQFYHLNRQWERELGNNYWIYHISEIDVQNRTSSNEPKIISNSFKNIFSNPLFSKEPEGFHIQEQKETNKETIL